jgi:hypothetical protein
MNVNRYVELTDVTLRPVRVTIVAAKKQWLLHILAETCGRAVYGVGLRPLACWDCGFESRREAWMSVCCECSVLSGRGLWDGPITRSEESYRVCGVSKCDCEASTMRRPWPTKGCRTMGNKIRILSVFVVLFTQHAKRMRHITLSSVACLVLRYFPTLSHKRQVFGKKSYWT